MALGAPINSTSSTSSGTSQNYNTALYSIMVLFFMMGFITCLNDILIPYLKLVFKLNYTQVNLINLCFFSAYLFVSIPAGKLIEKYGYKNIMITGFVIAAIGASLFYPAANIKVYGLFLGALFVLATGITLLQVAANPYVAVLGTPETSSARLTLTQALNSLGTTVAPLIGTYVILKNIPDMPFELKGLKSYATEDLSTDLNNLLNDVLSKTDLLSLERTYIGISAVLLLIGGILFIMKLPVLNGNDQSTDTLANKEKSSIWEYTHLIFGMIGIFAYVGAEVSIGSHIINYLEMKNVMSMSAKEAGNYVTYYWGSAMVGRFLGTIILSRVSPTRVLTLYALSAITLIIISISSSNEIAMWSLLGVGFFNSLMFPTIFTLAIKGLGKYTEQASGLLCTAIVGGAIVPLLFGKIADTFDGNLKIALIIPIICYAYISWFGSYGSKVKEEN